MRVTRITDRPNSNKDILKRESRPRRRVKKYVKESEDVSVVKETDLLNNTKDFTYAGFERNKNYINLVKHQIDQCISNYGIDLVYFRKYNTFFKEGEENHANMIYGEDTTAEFYASGVVRAFASVDSSNWMFNQMGIENTEQITIYLSIENFEQAFISKVGKVETKYFEIPVSGNTINNEVTGMIDTREFQASVYATIDDRLRVKTTEVTMIPRQVDIDFYKTRTYQTNAYPISGDLHGRLTHDKEHPFVVYGFLEGDLSYHSLNNVEDAATWHVAPQVGDYFQLNTPTGLDEKWEITQVFDRNLTKSGLNPFLGKYVFQVSATKRMDSHEKNTEELNYREPGEDIEEIFNMSNPQETEAEAFKKKKGKNVQNELTNKLGKNAYDYVDGVDMVYGRHTKSTKIKITNIKKRFCKKRFLYIVYKILNFKFYSLNISCSLILVSGNVHSVNIVSLPTNAFSKLHA